MPQILVPLFCAVALALGIGQARHRWVGIGAIWIIHIALILTYMPAVDDERYAGSLTPRTIDARRVSSAWHSTVTRMYPVSGSVMAGCQPSSGGGRP